jgi:hypothetical protein
MQRGLAPRVFDYLYQKITEETGKGITYNCRCSFLEIYNETIQDLLCPSDKGLQIREDTEKGPYVEGLSEPCALNGALVPRDGPVRRVQSPGGAQAGARAVPPMHRRADPRQPGIPCQPRKPASRPPPIPPSPCCAAEEMLGFLTKGADSRHTGETRLNHESSRSHSVFTCVVEKTVTSDGVSKIFFAKIHLIDLAGVQAPQLRPAGCGGACSGGRDACHFAAGNACTCTCQ